MGRKIEDFSRICRGVVCFCLFFVVGILKEVVVYFLEELRILRVLVVFIVYLE